MSYAEVGSDLGIERSTIRAWCEKAEAGELQGAVSKRATATSTEEELAWLRRENRILREEGEILKKSGGLLREGEPVTTYRFIRSEEANHSVRLMCRVLDVARSCYYAWSDGQTHTGGGDAALLVHIKAIHRQHEGRYGAPRVTAELRGQGFAVNRKRVARLMRQHGLVGRPRRVFRGTTTDSDHTLPVAPNLPERCFETRR